ncbi:MULTISPECIES: cytochrome c biogenesis CcdA family protein [unclassified Neisseria]|uniref:cytochrome c biogenesis CcdA family protein n=1 Tax=unclassified Neisseria TaxID=2623750 RepID=UPI00266689A5|nr:MULTISPECIES: cytochrome c biogenesis CcdA family protein [unclassified Neisseria]MDO1508866.1 cytochrome c biogenesis CcdA family protein [Neisseria sp. MVDL19-042950]MDO1515125.1 cytochrome c biogenesis CcdA family protein [Neisseria sp. MVDL18-041461]MDO1562485.1 cytochrome c biogenesis CcdA family protein [Neisseria sp. MVDL20-010259]
MDISITVLALSLLAGVLTTLSPCVLPILPIVATSAMAKQKIGLFALAFGMAVSFTLVGTVVASVGLALGLDSQYLRYGAAVLMLLVAIWLLNTRLQGWLGRYTSALSGRGEAWLSNFNPESGLGQLGVGLLLGMVWAPCIGPTLGAAIALASQGEALASVAVVMMVFSLGAVVPLIIIGLLSRQVFRQKREKLAAISNTGRKVMGWSLLAVGLLVLSGFDKQLEILLVQLSPEWLTDLTTRF